MNPVWLFVLISAVVISLVGTLAHFLYDIAHHNKVMGLFAAVNESTWEHTKIALTPMLLCGLVDGWLFGADPNYFLAKFFSLVAVIVLIPLLFYGYKALLGRDVLVLDILIFYVAIFAGQGLFGWLLMVGSAKLPLSRPHHPSLWFPRPHRAWRAANLRAAYRV